MTLAQTPKVELHLHHEGAAPPDLVRRLAQEKHISLDGVFDAEGNYAFRDFAHFLQVYEAATSVLQSPSDYARLTRAVLEQSAANGIIYTEVFLSPDFCGGSDLGAWREYLHAIREAATEAEAGHGIVMRGIVTPIRHFGPEKAKKSALCAAETAGVFIVGLGMGGDETKGHQGDFAYAFDMAREAGLGLTTHAGEFGGPASVREAVHDLRVARLGHGVRAIEDPRLVEELAEAGIVLEVCPGSNLALGLYPSLHDHPVSALRAAGVKLTLSTDDPPFFRTTLCREYDQLADALGWDTDDFLELNKTAAEAAFCDDATRARILDQLETPCTST